MQCQLSILDDEAHLDDAGAKSSRFLIKSITRRRSQIAYFTLWPIQFNMNDSAYSFDSAITLHQVQIFRAHHQDLCS
jgi:hypothetical protein